ncbi:sialic acid-binding Ig-like lectin 14 [Phyllostomus hastatus]|uniref:sialic acid-binding Ig-like lectin 14 n=1 Tax=Phyllostomus hastatus TaxID=9423 RepID=UPI001E67F323|nr:sialic acid-binding Ig-like lectin 14 [Phyllostomus hastatus]
MAVVKLMWLQQVSSRILELPHVKTVEEGQCTCQAQAPLSSKHVSFSLSVQRPPCSCKCVTQEQQGSWPLVLTLIRGCLMGAGFLLTYGLTWLYYTRRAALSLYWEGVETPRK